jgi:hypothetical protein
MKEDFRKKYPGAEMSKFDFQVTFAKDGTLESKDIFFKVTDLESYDIKNPAHSEKIKSGLGIFTNGRDMG